MSWIYKIYSDDAYKVGAFSMIADNANVVGEVIRNEIPQEKVDDFEAEYDDRFNQIYIVSCSGC